MCIRDSYVSVSVSMSLYVCLCLCLFLEHISRALLDRVIAAMCLCLSVCLCVCLCLCLYVSVSVSMSLYVCLCLCLFLEHISRALLDRVIAAMQAGHQKHMFTSVEFSSSSCVSLLFSYLVHYMLMFTSVVLCFSVSLCSVPISLCSIACSTTLLSQLYTVSQKMHQLWNGIAQNYIDRFWWHSAEMFKICLLYTSPSPRD